MLPFFPMLYPDELLYSVLARYHQRSRNKSYRSSIEDLYNTPLATMSTDLNNGLGIICKNIHESSLITPDYMIQYHTIFPLYKPFLPQDRITKITQWMKDPVSKGNIHKSIGIMAGKVPMLEFLRYCPMCCEEDTKKYGEPYWHRSHQIFGINICHKHNNFLIDSSIKVSSTYKRQGFYTLFQQYKLNNGLLPLSSKISPHEVYLANSVYWILNNDVPVLGLDKLYEKYHYELHQKGFVLLSGRVKRKELIRAFIDFYGYEILQCFNLSINPNKPKNWLISLVHKSKHVAHPLQHLLLMNFLGIRPAEFINSQNSFIPFGIGPWPCLNPITSHYHQNVIIKLQKLNNNLGEFQCPLCGFTYSRRIKNANSTKIKINAIISYGAIWEDKLKQLWKKNKTPKEIANILKVDIQIVQAKLIQYRITEKKSKITEITIHDRREQWLKILANNPNKSRNQIQVMFSTEYYQLYRNDKVWLMANLPPHGKYRKPKVDWEKRDEELASQIPEVVKSIKNANIKPIRVTIRAIGKKLNKCALLEQQLDKLPKTKQILKRSVETHKAFYLRKERVLNKNNRKSC